MISCSQERRKEAARAALEAESDKREAVAAEQRRRLQLENAARLERTARRDLMEERELIRTMLLRAKETAAGGGASRPMQTSPDRSPALSPARPSRPLARDHSPVHSSARGPTEDPERAAADADTTAADAAGSAAADGSSTATDRGESPISRPSLRIALPTPTEGASRSAHVDDETLQPSSSARLTLRADELSSGTHDDAAAADDSVSCASCESAAAATAVPAAGAKGKAEKGEGGKQRQDRETETPSKKGKATSAKSGGGAERTIEKVKAKLAATPNTSKTGALKGRAK